MIESRRNYQDEEHKRLQATIMLSCNELPPIEPIDACLTLQVFEYSTVFQPQYVIDERGDNCPKHWKVADPDIKKVWIQRPDIIDAFTMMVLDAWKPELLKPPAIVIENTKQFNGAAAVSEYDRFVEIVKYNPSNSRDTEFLTEELELILNNAGLKGMNSQKINMLIRKVHGHNTFPPFNNKYSKGGKRGYGWNHLKINRVLAYNAAEERHLKNLEIREQVRQQVRLNGGGSGDLGKRTYDEMMEES
jgi:hypothetical protein